VLGFPDTFAPDLQTGNDSPPPLYGWLVTASSGINEANVTEWFEANLVGVSPPLSFEMIAAGHSNLTFRVTDAAGSTWVLRRPPLHQVLATAHDMSREHRIISALHGTIPVPRSLGLCEDNDVNERPFYVMEFVDGLVLRNEALAMEVPASTRRDAALSLVSVLAALHAVDPDSVGLGDLGRKEAYVARQLRRWKGQYEASQTMDRPAIAAVHDHLAANIPEQHGAGIVHGDYRLDNCMIDPDGQVIAVLDWELCTLGDVMADVAMLLAYWSEPDDDLAALEDSPTLAPGFLSRVEVVAEYERVSGRDMSDLDFYLAFANWRLACILEGVYSRYVGGAMGDKAAPGVEGFLTRIDACVARAKDHASRVG
jgi:aminoglycoside phosphotransferase (APT) family kinase protein